MYIPDNVLIPALLVLIFGASFLAGNYCLAYLEAKYPRKRQGRK